MAWNMPSTIIRVLANTEKPAAHGEAPPARLLSLICCPAHGGPSPVDYGHSRVCCADRPVPRVGYGSPTAGDPDGFEPAPGLTQRGKKASRPGSTGPCLASLSRNAALTRATCADVAGKLPNGRSPGTSCCSASSPSEVRAPRRVSKIWSASSSRPAKASASTSQNEHATMAPSAAGSALAVAVAGG